MKPLKERMNDVVEAETLNFLELVKLSGLDPATDFRFMRLKNVDFSRCDLSGFDFTGSDIKGANFEGAIISDAIFDDKQKKLKNIWRAKYSHSFNRNDKKTNRVLEWSVFREIFSLSRDAIIGERQQKEISRILLENWRKFGNSRQEIINSINNAAYGININIDPSNFFSYLARGRLARQKSKAVIYWLHFNKIVGLNDVSEILGREQLQEYLDKSVEKLVQSCEVGNFDLAESLLDLGVDSGARRRSDGHTPLIAAVQNNQLEIASLLLSSGAEPNGWQRDKRKNALMLACETGNYLIVERLIEAGADFNQTRTDDGATALMFASYNGHEVIARLLLDKGADVNLAMTNNGATALMCASLTGHEVVVRLLLDKGADVNQVASDNGATALMCASQNGHEVVARLLLEYGANFNQRLGEGGKTALDIARENQFSEIVNLIDAASDK